MSLRFSRPGGGWVSERRSTAMATFLGLLVFGVGAAEGQIATGTYQGDGSAGRAITAVGFRPDVVIVKVDYGDAVTDLSSGVVRTSTMSGVNSKPLKGGQSPLPNLITSLDATGFTVGNDLRVNDAATCAGPCTYYWLALKADASLKVGSYDGDGGVQAIAGLGFSPEYVAVFPEAVDVSLNRFAADANTYHWWSGDPNNPGVTSLDADGFAVTHSGGTPSLNRSGTVYHYLAITEAAGRIRISTYPGTGSTQDVTSVGFRPALVLVKGLSPAQTDPFHKTTAMAGATSITFKDVSRVNGITAFRDDGFRVGTYTGVSASGVTFAYLALAAGDCCALATTEVAGSTITVTAADRFEMRLSAASGGGIDRLHDLAEDPTKTYDLAGGANPDVLLLHGFWVREDSGSFAYHTTSGSPNARLDLLEATPTRVRVRGDAFYREMGGSTRIGGAKGVTDFSIYGIGRAAVRFRDTNADPGNTTYGERALGQEAHYTTSAPLDTYTPCYEGNSACNTSGVAGSGRADWVLGVRDVAGARTDFLTIVAQDWTDADDTIAYGPDPAAGLEHYSQAWVATGAGLPASQTWNMLTYFKPTSFVDHTDTAVTYRSSDYRGPDSLWITAGSPWNEDSQLTTSDHFNEAEAAYLLTMDPSLGLTFQIDGAATGPRYSPFFKIRHWRSLVDTPVVRLNGSLLTKDVQYRANVKPLSRAHWASTLSWHCTMESTTACDSANIDVGVGVGTAATGTTATAGRYGNGLLFAANTDRITAGSADLDPSIGAIDFWYQPRYAPNDGGMHFLWYWQSGSGPYNCFGLAKTAADNLELGAVVGSSDRGCNIGGATYTASAPAAGLWRAYDWVHLKTSWNAAGGTRKLRIVLNGVEIAFSGTFVAPSGSATPIFGGCSGVDCPGAVGGNPNGVIDEVHIYGGLELAAYDTNTPLAHAGLTSDAGEYLADPAKSATLSLTAVSPADQGSYLYFGSDSTFHGLNVALATPGAWSVPGDLVWEFWNGTQWTTLESGYGFTDGTSDFTRDGTIYWTGDPSGWAPYSVNGGPDLYYIRLHMASGTGLYSTLPRESMVKTDILLFQYCGDITAAAQEFQFGTPAPTAVRLMSFEAVPGDSSVLLEWRTGSELDNLGFHVHRGLSADGPWTRLTSSLIPGLGSSPLGQAYSWLDTGLVNGTTYCYRLEDVDTSSRSTFHGPVCTEPSPPGGDGGDDGGGDGSEREGSEPVSTSSCPSWVLAAAPDIPSPVCTRHGDPESVSLQVLARDASSATLELRTGGFWALHDASGTVRVFMAGLEFPSDPKAPALPVRRALVEAVVGKGVELVSAEAFDLQTFREHRPAAVGAAELLVRGDGTLRPGRRSLAAPLPSRGYQPREVARLAGTVFQGERKSAVVEITPVRFSGTGLVLAGRVRVGLAFTGVAEGESGTGSRGRALPLRRGPVREVLAQLHTSARGLHAVRFEQLFPQRGRGFSTSLLRLQRQGEAVAFHVEPRGTVFGPGSVLYFYADRKAGSREYSPEVAYEFVRSREGLRMAVSAAPAGGVELGSASTGFASFETNRIYQPGLVEAEDVWLWDYVPSGATRAQGFALSGVDTGSGEPARLVVYLQGGSESGQAVDHHVVFSVNEAVVGESSFAGKRPHRVELSVPAWLLKEGTNELRVLTVGDTGVVSRVYLDRFEISYPQASLARGGVFEGVWAEGGTVEVGGVSGPAVILRDSRLPGPEGSAIADSSSPGPTEAPRNDSAVSWLTGFEVTGSSVRFQAEPGRRYLVVSAEGLLSPRVGQVAASTLRDRTNQADYLVIAPREFLEAGTPLVERRRSQGLVSRVVAFEEIASEFGHGQASAEAIREFLKYAWHSWRRPSPRCVLLLGDATDDPQRFQASSWPSPLPALWTRTSYLWTASDPALGAVNGEDGVPDLSIGRLPATTLEEAEGLVSKLLAWEESGQGLEGRAVLVADEPDAGGDFEADVEDVRASFLSGRETTVLRVRELGGATRGEILEAFDEGASLMSYAGHGGTAVWSSSNVWASRDAASLRGQSRQPVLLTMNCLNGYFVAPNLDSLSEALLKAEGRGVVAAFSPSGLSLDGPAHTYHRAVMEELTSGRHERLGDAVLAAQRTYADSGLMPELLQVYQLLGDPAMRIR